MAYNNKPEETLADKVGSWCDRAMVSIAMFMEEKDPLRRARALAAAMDALNVAAGRCAAEFVFIDAPGRCSNTLHGVRRGPARNADPLAEKDHAALARSQPPDFKPVYDADDPMNDAHGTDRPLKE